MPWFDLKGEIQFLERLDVRVDLSCETYSSNQRDPGDILSTNTMRNAFVRGVLVSLKSSVMAFSGGLPPPLCELQSRDWET